MVRAPLRRAASKNAATVAIGVSSCASAIFGGRVVTAARASSGVSVVFAALWTMIAFSPSSATQT
jgi:hypothetical protein